MFRNIEGLIHLIDNVLRPNKIPLLSATEDLDIDTADGRAMIYLKGIFDEKQCEDIVKRNKDAAATRAEQGFAIGQVGYGWIWAEKANSFQRRGIMPCESEKHRVLHIKERYLSGWNS